MTLSVYNIVVYCFIDCFLKNSILDLRNILMILAGVMVVVAVVEAMFYLLLYNYDLC